MNARPLFKKRKSYRKIIITLCFLLTLFIFLYFCSIFSCFLLTFLTPETQGNQRKSRKTKKTFFGRPLSFFFRERGAGPGASRAQGLDGRTDVFFLPFLFIFPHCLEIMDVLELLKILETLVKTLILCQEICSNAKKSGLVHSGRQKKGNREIPS